MIISPFGSQPVLVLAVLAGLTTKAPTQSSVRGWGVDFFDTAVNALPAAQIDAAGRVTAVRRIDGRVFVRGWDSGIVRVPEPPPGQYYVDVAVDDRSVGILSNGDLVEWATPRFGQLPPPPVRPPGVSWTKVKSSETHSLALRSDGGLVAWGCGTCQVPALAAGLRYIECDAAFAYSVALVSDGTMRCWGSNQHGQCNVPTLPPGVTFTSVAAGGQATGAIRSDGRIEVFGDLSLGRGQVPALPPGVVHTKLSVGWHCAAVRSDGQVVAWGNNSHGQCNVPALPPGLRYVEVAVGSFHTVALRSDGEVITWGSIAHFNTRLPSPTPQHDFLSATTSGGISTAIDSAGVLHYWGAPGYGLPNVPTLPPGVAYVDCAAGYTHCAALGSDGQVRAWGNNLHGQLNIPSLPPGETYTDVACGTDHTVLLRSDGQAVACGYNALGETNIPPLPHGTRYVHVTANERLTVLLRSDGVTVGTNPTDSRSNALAMPAGVFLTQIEISRSLSAGLRSDGRIAHLSQQMAALEPPLPGGVHYVEIAWGYDQFVARRSDGQVVAWFHLPTYDWSTPALDPGTSYTDIDAGNNMIIAVVGPTSTYTTFATGCAGSLPATSLVPRDTPRIGNDMDVLLDHLPVDLALVAFGWTRPATPVSLAPYGAPGCVMAMNPGVTLAVSGSGGHGRFTVKIPRLAGLVGLSFYNQALVFDPNANNSAGVVVSDAAEGVIGR